MKKEESNKFETCPCMDGRNEDNAFVNHSMIKCMSGAKWFLLVPGVLIALAFLLGYLLEPATVRMLWLIITGVLLTLGTTFYILINTWAKGVQKKIRCLI